MTKLTIALRSVATTTPSAEVLIREAAFEEFSTHGLLGARLQSIADKAGISRASLHYYFRSKEKLYEAITHYVSEVLMQRFGELRMEGQHPRESVEAFVSLWIDLALEEPKLMSFLLTLLVQQPQQVNQLAGFAYVMKGIGQIETLLETTTQQPGSVSQVLIDVMSLCVYPILSKQIILQLHGMSEQEYLKQMSLRKAHLQRYISLLFE